MITAKKGRWCKKAHFSGGNVGIQIGTIKSWHRNYVCSHNEKGYSIVERKLHPRTSYQALQATTASGTFGVESGLIKQTS